MKTKTHSHSWAGNPWPVHVYLCSLEISSLSHSPRTERPSRASSSACVGIDPAVNARSPKESPRLSRDPNHIRAHSASRSLETFCFYIWVRAQAQFVCIVYKKPNRKPQDLFGIPDQLLRTRKTNPLFHYYVWRLFFSEFVLPWHQLHRAVMQNFPLFMFKYTNGKYFNNTVQW